MRAARSPPRPLSRASSRAAARRSAPRPILAIPPRRSGCGTPRRRPAGGGDVRVNNAGITLAPGPTATSLFLDGKPQEVVPQFAKQAPLECHGQPEDIAADVSFLGGPDGSWINGQVLRSNDGLI